MGSGPYQGPGSRIGSKWRPVLSVLVRKLRRVMSPEIQTIKERVWRPNLTAQDRQLVAQDGGSRVP
jgi:hypothetical protein